MRNDRSFRLRRIERNLNLIMLLHNKEFLPDCFDSLYCFIISHLCKSVEACQFEKSEICISRGYMNQLAAILFLVAAGIMVTAYWPRWINMPVTIKNYRQVELKAQSARIIAVVIALFPAFFTNPEWMNGTSGTIIGIGFTIVVMAVIGFYVWKMEKAGK